MEWKPVEVLFNPQYEFLILLKDVRGWGSVSEVYINKNVVQAVTENAIESAVIVNEYFEKLYVKGDC